MPESRGHSSDNDDAALARERFEWEKHKDDQEQKLKERSQELAEREMALKEREFSFKDREAKIQRWFNPLYVAIVVGAFGLAANAIIAYFNGTATRALEDKKAEQNRVLEAFRAHDTDKASVILRFLIDTHLFNDEGGYVNAYLQHFQFKTEDLQLITAQSVYMIAGPLPHDVGPHTYVFTGYGTQVLTENPEALIDRLQFLPPLVKLTRPNDTPVWIKGAAVTEIRAPLPAESQPGGRVNAVLVIRSLHQAVHEDVPTARATINAHGGHLPP